MTLSTHDIVQQAQDKKLRLIRFLYCDNGGIIRGKATHVSKLVTRLQEGIGQTRAMQAFTGVETLAEVDGLGPVGEFRILPDPETFVVLPYVPHTGTMFCDLVNPDGTPSDACPRTFLKQVLSQLTQRGIRVEAAVEHEFYLTHLEETSTGKKFTPADSSLCYSSIGLDEQATVVDAILEALEAENLSIELFHTELGPSQQEISLRHTDALRAADNVLLVRETIRGVARQHNRYATFAPKPFLDQAGNGAHVHISLWGTEKSKHAGKNLFYDPSAPNNFSQLGLYFIGGILRHIHGLTALTNGSPNSYRRLLPHYWSSAFSAYGFDNREGAVRIPSQYKGNEEQSTNIEFKPADHSGNPYLALGALLAAGLDGITNRIDPGQAQTIDPGNYSDQERAQRGIDRLPTSLDEALDALENDQILTTALGPLLSRAYIAVKRNEAAFFKEKSPEEETFQHFYKY
jgi:glutamine synthetase